MVGQYLLSRGDRSWLFQLAESDNLWEQRIAIVSTIAFIRQGFFDETFHLAKQLMNHPHDLIHKATGWMLREVGKQDKAALTEFLETYATRLPRTTLRYAIEKYPEPERLYFLNKKE